MNLYNLSKNMLVKMVSEIRRDMEKRYRDNLEKLKVAEMKVKKAEEAGVCFQECNVKGCENYYAKVDRINVRFFYCEFCDKEYCDDHEYYCEDCDDVYCEYCHEEHFVSCETCNTKSCKYSLRIKCDNCGISSDAPNIRIKYVQKK